MAALTTTDIADLVASTKPDYGEGYVTDLSGDLQNYHCMGNLMKKERVSVDGGSSLKWNVVTDDNGRGQFVGLYNQKSYNVKDVLTTASIDWRWGTTDFTIDIREESINSASKKRILDLIKIRRFAGLVSWAKLVEAAFWTKPASSSDTTTPFGVDYYIVKNATEGFNGGNPSGFSAGAGGLSSTTYPRWANWAAQYSAITVPDLLTKWDKAATFTDFEQPVEIPTYNTGNKYGFYTNYTVLGPLKRLLEQQNESLGYDLDSMNGKVVFRRVPVYWVSYLEDANYSTGDSQDPVFGINWGDMNFSFLEDWYFRELKPRTLSDQPTVVATDIYWGYNLKCTNRRSQFVLATA